MKLPTIATTVRIGALLSMILAQGCEGPGHAHEPGEEAEHGGHGGHGGHGHGDDEDGRPSHAETAWTEKSELFVEYPALVVGQESGFLAHVTEMETFRAVTGGSFAVTVALDGGPEWTSRAEAPVRPGIFRPTITPTRAGPCRWRVAVDSPQVVDAFPVGPCRVFADVAAARAASGDEAEPAGRISYLKEQQWQTDFATSPVIRRRLQASVQAPATMRVAAGREAGVGATAPGRLVLSDATLRPGAEVAAGQVLATVVPRIEAGRDPSSLVADERAASAELRAARTEKKRLERLLAAGAIGERRVIEARRRAEVALAHLAGAKGRAEHYRAGADGSREFAVGFEVRAPIAGTLVSVHAVAGETVEEGQALFRIVDLSRLWLVARVFEADLPAVQGWAAEATGAVWFVVEGHETPFEVAAHGGRLVTLGHAVDPRSRTVPVVFELDNPDGRWRVGHFATVALPSGPPLEALAIPEDAVLDEAGRKVVFVMVEGEAFERRTLRLGVRDRGLVQVVEGLAEGERVVTRGAYEVKLAGTSGGIPSHGHVH